LWPTTRRISGIKSNNLLRQLATAVVYSNTWIATGAALLTAQTYWVLNLDADSWLITFVLFSSLATYNFQRILRFDKWWLRAKSVRLHWLIHSRKFLISLTIIAALGAAFCGWFSLNQQQLILLVPLGVISVLYAWRIFPSKSGPFALRDIPGTKVFWIAISWSMVTVLLPLMTHDLPPAEVWMPVLAERFCFILAITIPFDVRDLPFDSPDQKNLPQLVGIRRANFLAITMAFVFVAFAGYSVLIETYSITTFLVLAGTGVVTCAVLLFSFKPRPEPYYSVLLDGLTILQPLLIWTFMR